MTRIAVALALPLLLTAAGCASVPLTEGGGLSTYANLGEEKGRLAKSRIYVDGPAVGRATSVRIAPTTFTEHARSRVTEEQDRALVANALDRAVCVALSDRFRIVPFHEPADLTVRAAITELRPTNKTMAGVATVLDLGSSAVLPVSLPRPPIGLGGLAVEAEAVDQESVQRAAVVWARGANSLTDDPRVSEVGDAYGLATQFGGEFARLLVVGRAPRPLDISVPSRQRIRSMLGGEHRYDACEAFGRAPGVAGLVASRFGAPPQWTDKAAPPPATAPEAAQGGAAPR